MAEGHATATIYPNPGAEADDFPWAVALDDHEPIAVFSDHSYAVPFAATLLDLLALRTLAIVDVPEGTHQ